MAGELSGGDLSRLRQLNALAVIKALQGGPSLTLTEVAKHTGLSRASTEDVVRELLGKGWLAEAGATAGGVGRPARRYRFRADAGRVLGIDIGGHKIRAVVADLDGNVEHSAGVPVTPEMGRLDRLAAVDRAAAECLAAAGMTGADVWASGVGTTGLVDGSGRVLLSEALPEWTGVDLAAHVRRLAPAPVLVENDSKLAALAECWRGVARYAKDMVFLLAGLRTGAGLVIDGKLHRGFANASGEIGALPVLGWLRAQEHLTAASGEASDVFAAARAGDKAANAAVRRYVKDLALGASALVLALDPQMVVVGGGFSRSADVLIEPLRRELDRWCIRTPEVRMSALGDEAVVLGAVRLALDDVEDRVLDGRTPLVSQL
ncbi:Sugar kinase of the NBD/HSP70 family, may contain an N-terminal HTH domain [Nonomuraea solani]|uniref:Sugar kinase of the NBD/HSP70 family, may contain an N-terminal HTH domain n=1 Tax=Nonomuraea solani TaxID=1144553 RepID=A0A1H5UQN0_9ACTN|nr:ROK family protein [Nonomuraea solani]SEF76751.1 Sugar kinase of the NBD/HSP70 family, may contain an N-terminal HTH domain [Nonomuraea solani]